MSEVPESGDGGAVHSNVRDLVKQIKTGEKNKPDAFLELREVLKQSRARAAEQTNDGGGHSVAADSLAAESTKSRSSAQFTRESRHAIISQIIEKKKQQRLSSKHAESTAAYADEAGNALHENQDVPSSHTFNENESPRPNTAFPSQYSGNIEQHYDDRQEYWPQSSPRGFDAPRERPQSAGRLQSSRSRPISSASGMKRSSDDNVLDSRNLRVMQYESRLRNEIFKECTFHPQIKPLPSSYGAMKEKDTPFLSRIQHWQREKEISAARRKSVADRGEVTDCTFHPRINRNSARAARDMRPVDLRESTADRLYRAGTEIAEQKARFLEEERRREKELEVQDCTFQPELRTNNKRFQHVTPKFDRYPDRKETAPVMPKDCTFTPKVRGVRKSMDSAALYVSTNVVDRLTRPFGNSNQGTSSNDDLNKNFDVDRPVMDMASFMGSLGNNSTPRASFAGTTPKARPSSAPHTRPSSAGKVRPQLTEEEKEEKKRNQEAFLFRQTQTELRKKKHVDDLQKNITPKFTPELCRKSLAISNSTNRGEFLERLERDNQRRLHEIIKKQTSAMDHHSFHPELTKKAERMRPRSSYELSRGDLLKKETSQRMLKLKLEQEELKKLTFKPQVSRLAQNTKSTLQLREDPQGYVQRQARAEKEKEAYRIAALQQREMNESLGCTFAPVTKDCPAYVKRIARSLSIVKAARTVEAPPARPEWR